jgi:hypothetical protein
MSGIERFYGFWYRLPILTGPKRNLRVAKWLGTIPAIGVCTFCNREFKVPLNAMKRVADAQESLRLQFTAHKCKTGAPGATAGEQHPK